MINLVLTLVNFCFVTFYWLIIQKIKYVDELLIFMFPINIGILILSIEFELLKSKKINLKEMLYKKPKLFRYYSFKCSLVLLIIALTDNLELGYFIILACLTLVIKDFDLFGFLLNRKRVEFHQVLTADIMISYSKYVQNFMILVSKSCYFC